MCVYYSRKLHINECAGALMYTQVYLSASDIYIYIYIYIHQNVYNISYIRAVHNVPYMEYIIEYTLRTFIFSEQQNHAF